MPAVVQVEGVTRRYGGRWALRGVDLTVEAGRATMLCGANGSGKTTLLRVVSTAIRPTTGRLLLFGDDRPTRARPRVILLSHADGHYDDLSARENLELAAQLGEPRGLSVGDALRETGLAERADDLVRGFSAGMRKRLGFARVLVKGADLVLLDEPYASLDPAGARFVDALVTRLRESGATLLVSTHQVARAAALCDDAVLLDLGRVSWRGPATEVPASVA